MKKFEVDEVWAATEPTALDSFTKSPPVPRPRKGTKRKRSTTQVSATNPSPSNAVVGTPQKLVDGDGDVKMSPVEPTRVGGPVTEEEEDYSDGRVDAQTDGKDEKRPSLSIKKARTEASALPKHPTNSVDRPSDGKPKRKRWVKGDPLPPGRQLCAKGCGRIRRASSPLCTTCANTCRTPGCGRVRFRGDQCKICADARPCATLDCKNLAQKRSKAKIYYCPSCEETHRCIKEGCINRAVDGHKSCHRHGGTSKCTKCHIRNAKVAGLCRTCGPRCKTPSCANGVVTADGLCMRCVGWDLCKHPDGCIQRAQSKSLCIFHGGQGAKCTWAAGCDKRAIQGKLCSIHGGGHRHVLHLLRFSFSCCRCQGCNLFASGDPTYKFCFYCSKSGTKRGVKEQAVATLLETNITTHSITARDKAVGGNSCLLYRPDILYDCKSYALIIEVDEHQHSNGYDKACEQRRMEAIQETLAMRTVFIRYNPDAMRVAGVLKATKQAQRHAALLERVRFHLANEPAIPLTVEFLFYDQA